MAAQLLYRRSSVTVHGVGMQLYAPVGEAFFPCKAADTKVTDHMHREILTALDALVFLIGRKHYL